MTVSATLMLLTIINGHKLRFLITTVFCRIIPITDINWSVWTYHIKSWSIVNTRLILRLGGIMSLIKFIGNFLLHSYLLFNL